MADNQQEVQTVRLKNLHSQILKGTQVTHTFNVDFSEVREDFKGTFVVRRPSQLDRLQIGILKSTLLGGVQNVDIPTENIAVVASTLDVVLVQRPDWFNIDDPDLSYDIMEAVFLEYLKWDASFRKRVTGDADKPDSEDSRS
ncbi:hypothetical protein D1872_50580 [compost metagenome]